MCIIWSLSALGCQHAPSQQVLVPRMQLRQAEFASARACVRITLLAIREVPVSLSSVQHGRVLSSEWQAHRLQLGHASTPSEAPPSGFTLAGQTESWGAAVKDGPCVGHRDARTGGRRRR